MQNTQACKPEVALKRADELVQQAQPLRALNTLHDVISNRKNRMWQAVLEDVMLKHIDLCVSLRKGKHARDGLIQYRAICQQVNVGSLDKAIHYFLEEAEKKAKQAQENSAEAATLLLSGQDLDEEDTTIEDAPETLIMKAVSGESTKDRTDREILMPWIKFLWESYRTALDVTRTNPKLENIYHDTARKAFGFCQRYLRKVEFRRLCDLIRLHHLQKNKFLSPEQRTALLQSSESFNTYAETRFRQLQVATNLDLWQEAYRTIEDIHGIIKFFNKTPPSKLMMDYFDKLMKVFWVSQNFLFHAYACLKYHSLFSTVRQTLPAKKQPSEEEVQLVASKVMLSILCVPFWLRRNSSRQKDELFVFNVNREKNLRITTLLGSSTIPTRASLLLDMANRKIPEAVFPELQSLYDALEVQFDPLKMCHRIPAAVAFIKTKPGLLPYAELLQRVAAVRMVEQVCKVYDIMKIDELCSLCPYYTFVELEPLLVEVAKQECPNVHATINHHERTISFCDQEITCDSLSGQLSALNRRLEPVVSQCLQAVAPSRKPRGLSEQCLSNVASKLPEERQAVMDRKRIIEERKEKQEQHERALANEQDLEMQKQQEAMRTAEIQRIQEEAKERESLKKEAKERQETESQARALFTEFASQKGASQLKKAVEADESLLKDQERLVDEAKKMIMNAKEAREKRLREDARKMEYFIRACREEERPLLQKMWAQKMEEEKSQHKKLIEAKKVEHQAKWQAMLAEKHRLSKMVSHWEKFKNTILEAENAKLEELKAQQREEKKSKKKAPVVVEENDEEEQEEDYVEEVPEPKKPAKKMVPKEPVPEEQPEVQAPKKFVARSSEERAKASEAEAQPQKFVSRSADRQKTEERPAPKSEAFSDAQDGALKSKYVPPSQRKQ